MDKNYFNSVENTTFFSKQSIFFGLFLMFFLLMSLGSFGQTSRTFTTSGSFVIPSGVTSITVETWGAGGGGGNSANTTTNGGAGGGGGAYAKGVHTVVAGNTYYYSVGTGGTGGPANSTTAATAGSNSWFNATASTNSAPTSSALGTLAQGGSPGGNNGSSAGSGGLTSASYGNFTPVANANGSNGSAGTGSAGGAGGNGANPSGGAGGAGSTSDGNDGTAPGGGGGGSNDSGSNKGGNGGAGQVQVTYNGGTYKASFSNPQFGSSTWCTGETRTVSIDITNTGTLPWTDSGSTNFNIGVKWNGWDDYNERVDAENLAPGATKTYYLNITARNNTIATGYTTPLASGTNNLSFDVVYEGVAWFQWNNQGVGPGNPTYKTGNITISALPTISSHPATTTQNLCLNGAATALSVTAAAGSGTIQKYDWYSNTTASTTGGTLVKTNSVTSTTNTYTPLTTITGKLYYYVVVTNSNGCTVTSNVSGAITVSGALPSVPGFITGSAPQCPALTNQVYSVTPVTGATSYVWSVPSGWPAIAGGQGTNSITVTTGTAGQNGNIQVNAVNGCGTTNATGEGNGYKYVIVNPSLTGTPTTTGATSIQCDYAVLNWSYSDTNVTDYYFDIATDAAFTNIIPGYNNFKSNGTNKFYSANNLPAGNLYYRVRGYNSCATTASSVASTVFKTTAPLGGSVSAPQSICAGQSPTSNVTLSGYTIAANVSIIRWERATDLAFTANVSPISETTTVLSIAKMGVLNVSTYFRAVVQNQFGSYCTSYSTPVLITVSNSVSAASSTPTVCINSAIPTITHTTSGYTGIGTPTGLPSGVIVSFGSNTITITGTPDTSVGSPFNYTIPLTGGSCGGGNATGTITVNASPTGLSYTTASPVYCQGTSITTNSVTLTRTGTPAPTFSVSPALPAGLSLSTSTGAITGTPSVAVAATNYTVTATNSCGTAQTTLNITVNASPTGLSYTTASPVYCLGTAITSNTVTLTRTGTPAPAFSVSPALPAGLSMDTSTGAITGTPSVAVVATNYTVTATNSCGTTQVTLNITVNASPTGLSYTTASPVYCLGTVITANTVTLTRTGTPAPTFSVSPALPAGLSLSTSTGAITGTPSVAVVATNYTITATNSCGTTQVTLNITVNASPTGLSYTTASPVYCLGTVITANTVTLTRTGTPAPTFSVSPALPAGLSLSTSTGAITGTPSVAVAATNYTITATNSCGTTQVTLNITVNASPIGLSYTTASPVYCLGTVITANTVTLTRTGTPVPTFSVSPALPAGLSLSTSTGAITGTPSVAVAATNYTVTATNSCGTAQTTLNITVNASPTGLSYTTASPVYCLGTAITSNTVTLTRTGTPAPTFSVSPALPAGLSMDTSTGAITGTPSVAVVATNYTITATNSCGTTQVTLNITVNASPTGLSYTTASPVYCLGTVITTNSVTLTRTGTPTPIFSVSPALPVGLSLSTSTGAITGTPTVAVAATNYTVTATNSCGIAQATLNITVNSTPTLSTATQTIFACSQGSGSPATIKLTGLINGPFTVNYTIGGVAQPQVTGLTAVSGEASFSTQNLVIGDNNKLLQITGINTITCSKSFAGVSGIDLNLDVRPNSGDITLSPGSTVASGGLISTSELTNITFSITAIPGATGYTWVFPGNPGDWIVQGASGNNSITVKTGTRFQGGPVTVTANNFCGSTINVILTGIAPSAPIQNGVTAATCKDLGSITLGNLPVGSWSLTIKKVGESEVYDPTPRTGSTFPISGLAVGSYIFKVTDVYGTSIESNPIVVAGPLTKKWDGSSWLNNVTSAITITPTIEENAVFAGDYNSSGPIQSCSCQINSGATVTIKSGDVLIIENGLNVDPAGSLIFDSGASLVQNNPSKTINSGSITYKRNSSALKNLDYVYWSSPLESQALSGVFSGSNKMWFYDLGLWVPAVGTMVPAKGYIVRYSSAPSQNAVFVGKPNNGDYSIAALATGNYLIGNPYPSAIDADKFMEDNIAIIGGGILNFWAHNTERAESTDGTKYIYSASDYASYSQLGGTSATTGGFEPDGTIAAGQSFFVSNATGGGDLIFTNSMRISGLGKNSQFFKQATTKKGSKIEKSRLWLNLTNEKGLFKQLLVGYATGATNTHDNLFDGKTLNGNAFADFYSIEGSTNYTIQARSLPFTAEDEVPLGFKTTIAGTFQIKINKTDGSLLHQAIYLEDKTTNTVHDLKNGSYSFTAEIGTFNDRFVLRYNNSSKLGTDDNTIKGKGVIVSVKNRQIKINSFDQNLTSLKLYDLKGSLIYEKNKLNNKEFIIDTLTSATQFMVVMVQLEDGKWVSEEIIFND